MIAIAWYLLKVAVCSGILLGYYWLALRNKAFHHYNRFYLLCTVILSILLPFVQINFWQTNAQTSNAFKVIETVSYGNSYITDIVVTTAPLQKAFNWQLLYLIFYTIISTILLIGFIKMLFKIRTLLKKYPLQKIDDVTFINTNNERGTPFSFLTYIFWNQLIDTTTPQGNQIFKHELAHIKEKHTYDKLFINIILIVYWLNPFFWLLRKELNLLHEFIADKKAVEDGDTSAFAAMLLQTIYPQHQFAIANNFFYSPIKRRLIMLTKIKNPKVNYLGRILVLPIFVLLLAAFTFKVNKHNDHIYKGKKVRVVIDAGHGGERDPGAVAIDGTTEKELNLALVKRIKELNTNDNIEIVLTRETDVYQTPKEKADFANNLGAQLLVSVHIDKNPLTTATPKSGMNIFVAKNEYNNAATSKAFGSYMLQSFTSNYKLHVPNSTIQRGVGIWIIKGSNCPSILVEAGYINNENDLEYLKSLEGQTQFAKNILAGIENYLSQATNQQLVTDTMPKTLPTEAQWEKAAQNSENDLKVKPSVSITSENEKIDFYRDTKNVVRTKDNPLYVVDGTIVSKEEMEKLSPNNIEKIDILKGESAIKLYGDKGKNGVIAITTKADFNSRSNEVVVVGKKMTEQQIKNQPIDVNGNKSSSKLNGTVEEVVVVGKKMSQQQINNLPIEVTGYKKSSNTKPNIAIGLDKMNVLYIGLDNPVTIAVSGYRAEDLVVSMKNGRIQGKDGKYIANVSNTNPAEIIIETIENGERKLLGTQVYRVKHMPDPVNGKNVSDFDITPFITLKANSLEMDTDAKNIGKKPYIEVDSKAYTDNLNNLPKESIKHIKVIANKKAIELYGDKAKDGAILVTTKTN